MDDNNGLYNPMGLKEKEEYWNGFGKIEAMQSVITIIILNVINLIIFSVKKSTSFASIFFLTSVGASIMFYTKDVVNLSVYDRMRNMIAFHRSQKIYEYKYLDEWK